MVVLMMFDSRSSMSDISLSRVSFMLAVNLTSIFLNISEHRSSVTCQRCNIYIRHGVGNVYHFLCLFFLFIVSTVQRTFDFHISSVCQLRRALFTSRFFVFLPCGSPFLGCDPFVFDGSSPTFVQSAINFLILCCCPGSGGLIFFSLRVVDMFINSR